MIPVNAHTHRNPEDGMLAVVNLHKDSREVPATGYYSAGIHPWFIRPGRLDDDLERLRLQLAHPNVVAVGECGLDRMAKTPLTLQMDVFKKQLALASAFHKPLIIHNVRSGSELLEIKKSMSAGQPWLIHGFHGSERESSLFVQQGCYLGFGKMILNSSSKAIKACIAAPLEMIMPETDDDLIEIQSIMDAIARVKNLDHDLVASTLYHNFIRFYNLQHHA